VSILVYHIIHKYADYHAPSIFKRFCKLKDEIKLFVDIKKQDISLLSDPMWLQDLSFMVYITKHLSKLNLNLQDKIKL